MLTIENTTQILVTLHYNLYVHAWSSTSHPDFVCFSNRNELVDWLAEQAVFGTCSAQLLRLNVGCYLSKLTISLPVHGCNWGGNNRIGLWRPKILNLRIDLPPCSHTAYMHCKQHFHSTYPLYSHKAPLRCTQNLTLANRK